MSITTYEDSRILVLNSKDAKKNNGTMNSNIEFEFNGLLKEDTSIIQSHIQLIASQIPYSFYIINANNNVLKYTVSSVIYTITIPEGNYNAFNLITTMTSLFLANGHVITPVISRINGKITYTALFNFTFNTLGSTILKVLGFLPTTNTSSVANVLVSPYPLNLLGIKRLTITSQSLATTALNSFGSQTQSILATIYIIEPAFGLVSHSNTTNVNHLLKIKTINKIDLQIQDEDGFYIDFNNQDFTMKLLISSTYKLVLESPLTFKQITEPKPSIAKSDAPLVEPTQDEMFSPDNDLDLLLYNLKRPPPLIK